MYGEKERPKEVIALKKSVKAQVHSLETRGRHHRIITNPNPPLNNENPERQSTKSTFTKNSKPVNNSSRSRSENPPKAGSRGTKNGLSLPKADDFASRVNPDRINKKSGRNEPPPMPEKTKIHLKNETKAKKSDKRQRRPDQPLPDLPSLEPASLPSSHPYEILPHESSGALSKREQYRRSKSVGPVVEAAQRELLLNAARDRSRSRGPDHQDQQHKTDLKRSKSKSRLNHEEESNSSSGGRGRPAGAGPYRKENSSLESARGRSRIKNNVERSVSQKKIDVMDPFLSAASAAHSARFSLISLRFQCL